VYKYFMDVKPVNHLVVLCGLWPFMLIMYVVYQLHSKVGG